MRKGLSFALFDVGETILGALIFSTFFPLYITKFIDTKLYSLFYGLSFLLSFLIALQLGKLADARGIRKHLFVVFALGVSLLCAGIGGVQSYPLLALFLFLTMAISHQQALVFYNTLLMDFEKRGTVSGLGVSFGYIGSAFALLFLANYLREPMVYFAVAGIYLLFLTPSVLFLPNPADRKEDISIKLIIRDKKFLALILSILSITEVANTLISMMGVYLRETYGLGNVEIYKVIGMSAVGGILGGLFWGRLIDAFGVKRIFPLGFFLWIVFLFFLPLVPEGLVILAGLIAGVSLAHIWTCSRVYILEEFPSEESSVRLSFLSITERVASMGGLLAWAFFLLITDDNYRLSALLMSIFPLVGVFIYYRFAK